LAATAAALVAAAWAVPLATSYAQGIDGVDSMWYHLPQSASFVQSGSVWDLHFTDPYFLNWYYPAGSELLHAVPMLAFDRDWLSPLINHLFLALGLLAAWCIGRPWGLGPQALVGAAVVFGSEMMLDFQPGEARNDAIGLALFLAAVAFLVTARAMTSREGDGDELASASADERAARPASPHPAPPHPGPLLPALALAGLAAGLAVGTKLTMLAPVAALTIAAAVIAGPRARLRAGATFLAATLAGGGFWYLRNLVHSGNPLPWIDQLGPISLPAPEVALELRPPHSVAHYLTDTGVWDRWLLPGLEAGIGPLWPLILALTIGAGLFAVASALRAGGRRGGPPPDARSPKGEHAGGGGAGQDPRATRLIPSLGGVVLATLAAYLVTPLTASGPEGMPEGFVWNLRYIAPALGLGLVLLPLLPPLRGPRARLATLVGLFAILAVQTASLGVWGFGQASWAIGSAVLVAAGFLAAGLAIRNKAWGRRPALGLGIVATIALAAGYAQQDRYMERRYEDVLDGLRLDTPIAWANDVSDARIATAGRGGVFFQYGFYGADLTNEVQWVGEPGPRGAWLPIETCERWREAVAQGGYDYVVMTYDRRFPGLDDTSREREWIRRDSAAKAVLREGPVTVYELSGELDPAGCGPREAAAADRPTGVAERDE
jgi:hypothetical protein